MRRTFLPTAIIFLLCLAIIGGSKHQVFAEGNITFKQDTPQQVFIVKDGDAEIYLSDVEEPIGKLLEGSKLHASHKDENYTYFQWGQELAFISNEHPIVQADSLDVDKESISNNSIIESDEDTAVFSSEDNRMIGYIYKNIEYPITGETESRYELLFAGNESCVLKQSSVTNGEDQPKTESDQQVENSTSNKLQSAVLEEETVNNQSIGTMAQMPVFSAKDKFFKVTVDKLVVYDNSTGALVPIGTLEKGQVYERISDYGNWHRIRFGTLYGYVYKGSTVPANNKTIKNLDSTKNSSQTITAKNHAPVFDNTSGALVQFATIQAGMKYPIVGTMGNWYKVNVAGRLGYVHNSNIMVDFKASDKYFKVTVDRLAIYDNRTGKLVKVGELFGNHIYPRIRDYGNWHELQFGNQTVYAHKSDTVPASGATLKNVTKEKTGSTSITMTENVAIFDNTSGSLVKYGAIGKNVNVNIIGTMGNWYKVNFAGRLGYVHNSSIERSFTTSDRYFEVKEDDVYIYSSKSTSSAKLGIALKGQTFQRTKDAGNWHEIKFGKTTAFVLKSATRPSTAQQAQNWGSPKISDLSFIAKEDATVFDNTSGALVPFTTILKDERYPIISKMGNWWKISVGNRIGYVYKDSVIVGPVINYTEYDLSLKEMNQIQASRGAQTDLYRNDKSYVHKQYIEMIDGNGNGFPSKGKVVNVQTTLNIREGAGTSYHVVGSLKLNQTVEILGESGDWYEIKYGPWKNAKETDIAGYTSPANYDENSAAFFQFLVLSKNAGISAQDLNSKILSNKGILKGQGQAFVQASNQHQINEIYLLSHALLETGNGTSKLATGTEVGVDSKGKVVLVTSDNRSKLDKIKTVYNVFGIGAVDSCPNECGAIRAYEEGWFSVDAAIIGGAQFISSSYVNHPTYNQDTLYKMRWNPANPGQHQYATDIGWAVKQVNNIKKLYDLIDDYTLYFDVPVFK